jgi:uncharacterized protein YcfJ
MTAKATRARKPADTAQPSHPTRAPRPRHASPGFRGVRFNAIGWSAVLVPGAILGASTGYLMGGPRRRAARVTLGAAAGAVSGLAAARIADEIRWREMSVTIRVDEPDQALDVMQAVRAAGVQADMSRAPDPEDGGLGYEVRYRAKDQRRVRAVLAAEHR